MIQRCTNSKNTGYYMYGGSGITVCDQWLKFENFYNDMGDCGDNSLDRIDNTKGYYKDNCRWATKSEQANNRCSTNLFTINGITKSVAQWAKSIGQRKGALYYRISIGMTIEEAVTKPFPKRKKYPKKKDKLQHAEERLIWQGIKKRCKNGYTYLDDKFSDFDVFFKEVGERPSKEYSIDRINNKKGYEPGNIRWANKKEQAINRSTTILLTVDDKTMCKSDWAKLANTTIGTISKRLNLGWSHKDAIYGRPNL